MTPETVGFGIGMVCLSLGWLIIDLGCSAWAERRAQRDVRNIVDLVKSRTFLRRARSAQVPDLHLRGSTPVARTHDTKARR